MQSFSMLSNNILYFTVIMAILLGLALLGVILYYIVLFLAMHPWILTIIVISIVAWVYSVDIVKKT